MTREINDLMTEALDKAKELVTGDRQKDYGTPEESFNRIAALWTDYLDVKITAEDAAIMMALLKIARLRGGRKTPDTYHDLLGYGAIACALHAEDELLMASAQAHPFAGMKWRSWPEYEAAENPVNGAEKKDEDSKAGLAALVAAALGGFGFGAAKEPGEEFRKLLRAVPIDTPGTEQLWLAWQDGMRYGQENCQLPDGWQLVPKEPTEEMLKEAGNTNLKAPAEAYEAIYKVMLYRAPSHPLFQRQDEIRKMKEQMDETCSQMEKKLREENSNG